MAGGGPGSGGAAEEVLLDVEAGGLLGALFRVPFKPKLLEVLAAGESTRGLEDGRGWDKHRLESDPRLLGSLLPRFAALRCLGPLTLPQPLRCCQRHHAPLTTRFLTLLPSAPRLHVRRLPA